MEFIGTIIIGLLAGALAKLIMPGKDPGGIIVTILLGIAGAFIAAFLGRTLGWYEPNETAGFIGSVLGAMLLLLLYRLFRGKPRVT
ncbi:MAG: GlsB/YeaQ/YmgE family stress response membrane protein [Verrucomicrobiota bacterium]|nr:GlsB/YeaQ/YmgE family stress response membrane protein [Verrucomicrobiota bacterium]